MGPEMPIFSVFDLFDLDLDLDLEYCFFSDKLQSTLDPMAKTPCPYRTPGTRHCSSKIL